MASTADAPGHRADPIPVHIDRATLERLGLRPGEPARFRKGDSGRWLSGKIAGVAVDGSITLHDAAGAARSLRPDRVEVRRPGSRGRLSWQLVSDVAITWEQLALFADITAGPARHRRR